VATKIFIDKGRISCVYDDRFSPLFLALGGLHVDRASEVEFNHQTGEWEAKLLSTNQIIAHGKNRNEVIHDEVKWLEENQICRTQ
jgi:hypothetical protein